MLTKEEEAIYCFKDEEIVGVRKFYTTDCSRQLIPDPTERTYHLIEHVVNKEGQIFIRMLGITHLI